MLQETHTYQYFLLVVPERPVDVQMFAHLGVEPHSYIDVSEWDDEELQEVVAECRMMYCRCELMKTLREAA
jgi:hypothetical protein